MTVDRTRIDHLLTPPPCGDLTAWSRQRTAEHRRADTTRRLPGRPPIDRTLDLSDDGIERLIDAMTCVC